MKKIDVLGGGDLKSTDFFVKLGHTTQPLDPKGSSYNISRIFVHNEFNRTHHIITNDIALLTVSTRIAINKYVNPVCLPGKNCINCCTK